MLAFELIQMSSFSTAAIELIQKPSFRTATIGWVKLLGARAFFPIFLFRLPSPLLLRSSCPFSPSLLLLFFFFFFFSSGRLLLHFPLHLALLPSSPAGAVARRPIPSSSLHLLASFSLFQITPLAQCSPDVLNLSLNIGYVCVG